MGMGGTRRQIPVIIKILAYFPLCLKKLPTTLLFKVSKTFSFSFHLTIKKNIYIYIYKFRFAMRVHVFTLQET